MIGLRAGVGRAGSVGTGYMLAFLSTRGGRSGLPSFWFGAGYDLDLLINNEDAAGFRASAVARGGFMARYVGLSLELAGGVATDGDGVEAPGSAGLFLSLFFFEVGYTYQFSFEGSDLPSWLATHQACFRINVPLGA